MTIGCDETDTAVQRLLAGALKSFETAQEVLSGTLDHLRAEQARGLGEYRKDIRDMNAALMLTMDFERKARDAEHQRKGSIGAGQLDLDAARAEIGVRLACLRAAGGGGDLSGGAE